MTNRLQSPGWKKWAIVGIAVFATLVGASYLIYTSLGSGRLSPLALLALAAVISIAIPVLRSNYFPSERDCTAEYAFHEQRMEKAVVQRIAKALGHEALQRLFAAPDRFRADAAGDLEAMLVEDRVQGDPELRFALLVALARCHEKNGDPQAAILRIEEALAIKPDHFVVRMHLAGNYEWVARPEKARRHYRRLLEGSAGLSKAMEKLVASKIEALPKT